MTKLIYHEEPRLHWGSEKV